MYKYSSITYNLVFYEKIKNDIIMFKIQIVIQSNTIYKFSPRYLICIRVYAAKFVIPTLPHYLI